MKKGSVAIAFVLATSLAALSGCGGGGEEATPTATVTPTATATPQAAAGATPSPTPIRATYEVQRGDTLSEIADRFGVDVGTLAAANDIADPDLIYPGQVLIIPAQTP